MKTIIVFSCLIVIASASETTNQNENLKTPDLISVLTSDVLNTKQVVSDVIRSKRQFGGNIFLKHSKLYADNFTLISFQKVSAGTVVDTIKVYKMISQINDLFLNFTFLDFRIWRLWRGISR